MADNKKKATYDLIINGETANKTLKDLEGAAKQVRAQFKLTTDPADQEKLGKAYQRINEKISEQNNLLKGTSKATGHLKEAFGELAAAAGIAFSVDAVFGFGKDSIKAFAEAEKGATLLKNQITIVNGESAKSFRLLKQQSEALGGLYDDSDIQKVQLYFAQFGLGSEQIRKAIPAVIDTAAATGKSLDEVAQKIVTGSNGSKKAMREWGVVVEDSGSKNKNLEAIVDKLNGKFEGQAEIVGNTAAGAIQTYGARWENFKENIGEDLILFFGKLSDAVLKVLDPKQFALDAAKRKIAEQGAAIQETLADLNDKGLKDRAKLNKEVLAATLKEQKDVALGAFTADKAAKLARIQNDITYYQQSSLLITAELKKRSGIVKDADDDLTQKGLEDQKASIEALKKFNDDTEKLRDQAASLRITNIKDANAREFAELANKYEEQRKKIEEQEVKKQKGGRLSSSEVQRNIAVYDALLQIDQKYADDKAALFEKTNQAQNKKEFDQDTNNLELWNRTERLNAANQRKIGVLNEEQYQDKLNDIQMKYLTMKLGNLKDYGMSTVEVEQQIADLIIKTNDKTVQQLLSQYKETFSKLEPEAQKRVASLISELSVLVASGADPAGEAVKAVMEKITEEITKGTENSFTEVFQKIMQIVGQFADQIGSIWQSINVIADNRDKKRLQTIHTNTEKERAIYDKLLKNKQISQSDYQKHIEKLDKQEEQANKKASRDAAIRNQRLAVFSASLNAFQAITTTLAQYPYPFNIALAALTAFAAFKQVQAIKSEPLPEAAEGTILKGPKHNSPSRGITVTDSNGVPIVKAEGGELIGSAEFVEQNPDLAAAIVASGKNGGRLSPSFLNRNFPSVNIPAALQASSPGFTNRPSIGSEPLNGKAAVNYSGDGSSVQRQIDEQNILIQKQNELLERMHNTLDKGISAKFVYREFKKDIKRVETITGDK